MISIPQGAHRDFELSLSDVKKAFADVGKLTGPETLPMWKIRVETALQTIVDFYASRDNRTVPNEVTRAVFNVMTGHIGDTVMANYMNENMPHVLMEKLRERFYPKTTVADANEIFQLFHLRRPVHEMDKLLDDAQNLYSRIVAKGVVVPSHIFYSAIVGIIPPHYAHVRSSYKATVRTTTPTGIPFSYRPMPLIAELRREFSNWRLTHPAKALRRLFLKTSIPLTAPLLCMPRGETLNVQRKRLPPLAPLPHPTRLPRLSANCSSASTVAK